MHVPDTRSLDHWLEVLTSSAATDLHLAAGSTPRMRIDGELIPVPDAERLTVENLDDVIALLLDHTEREAFDRDRQIDLAFSWGDNHRFRVNAFHQMGRAALAIRVIPSHVPTPQEIGLPDSVEDLVRLPHGLVLVTGPTGSGKTTTLATMVDWINNNRDLHILTIEDPVEFLHESKKALVNQREVGEDAPTFAEAMRAALREDPDVVLVGEMRDLETISLALTLAETGHLVFGTLHTNDSAQTVDRIIDVFPPEQQSQIRTQFSLTLSAVISQRLVKRIGGGRVAAYEVLMGTPGVQALIREQKVRQIRNAISTGSQYGMVLLEQSLGNLVAAGTISMDEALHASVHPEEIAGLHTGASSNGRTFSGDDGGAPGPEAPTRKKTGAGRLRR
jgi:twitching motility protein PilT